MTWIPGQDDHRENFRVVNDGQQVEVDVTLTIDADTVMQDWWRLQRDLVGINGLRSVKVDDLPPALIRAGLAQRSNDGS